MSKVRLPLRWHFVRVAPLAAFLLIVVVGLVGFFQLEQADQRARDTHAGLCQSAVTDREALRQVYRDVHDLGVALVMQDDPGDPVRAIRLNALREFRDRRLAQIPPLPEDCPP